MTSRTINIVFNSGDPVIDDDPAVTLNHEFRYRHGTEVTRMLSRPLTFGQAMRFIAQFLCTLMSFDKNKI